MKAGQLDKRVTITFKVRVAWWVRWYVSALALFSRTTGMQPDIEKIGHFISSRGIKLEVET